MDQVVQIVGALLILLACAAAQFSLLDQRSRVYLVLNLVGSAVLTILAWQEEQWGFLLLEGVWALVSLWSLVQVQRGRAPADVHPYLPGGKERGPTGTNGSTSNRKEGEMTPTSRTRALHPLPLGLTLLIALLGAFLALVVWGGPAALATGGQHSGKGKITQKELALRNDMRKLWEDHVTWTRLAIISLTTDAPDTEATVGRLLQNQTDLGDAIKPFYGEAAGDELTRLLREHILIAADIIAAAKAGDGPGVAEGQARWRANADEIAAFLNAANPRSWKLEEMKEMLYEHLRLTTNEVVARLTGDWAADVAAYDQIHLQALEMADMLSIGIVEQFPKRFR